MPGAGGLVSEQEKDRLAGRQARAASALIRLGNADVVWPLLKHSDDPRLRSFIINWLKPLGVDAGLVVAEFHRVNDSAPRVASRGSRERGRRPLRSRDLDPTPRLILALGTYVADVLSAGETVGRPSTG